jgi:hypothetical protein
LYFESQTAVYAEDQAYLDEIHRGLQKAFELSKYMDYPFNLDEIVTYFLPGISHRAAA